MPNWLQLLCHKISAPKNGSSNAWRHVGLDRIQDAASALHRHHRIPDRYLFDWHPRPVSHQNRGSDSYAVAVPLVFLCILVAVQKAEFDARTVGKLKRLLLDVVFGAQGLKQFTGALDRFFECDKCPAKHDAVGPFAECVGMDQPVAQHAIGLAPTARATKHDLRHRTGDKPRLRASLRRPYDVVARLEKSWPAVVAYTGDVLVHGVLMMIGSSRSFSATHSLLRIMSA